MPLSRSLSRELSRPMSRTLEANVPTSGAASLLAAYTNGLAIDFRDMSMVVKDTGTPANAFSGDPNTKLTYSSPSTKWIRLASGLWASGTTMRTDDLGGFSPERQSTNLALSSRDLSNATYWTVANCTAARTADGADGVANSATTITATDANATVLQAITEASRSRITSCIIKRRTGSGTIQITQDNGSTWTTVTVTSSFTRVRLAAATAANPTVGIRVVTSGDAIDVDFFQHESVTSGTAIVTSPIATTTATVTRAADNIFLATSALPYSATECLLWAELVDPVHTPQTACLVGFNNNGTSSSGATSCIQINSTNQAIAAWHANQVIKTMAPIPAAGDVIRVAGCFKTSGTLAAITSQGLAAATAATSTWNGSSTRLQIGALDAFGAQVANMSLRRIMFLPTYDTALIASLTA